MGDLFRLINPSSPLSAGCQKGSKPILISRDQQQPGTSRVPCRSPSSSSKSQRKLQWRALLDERRLPFSFHAAQEKSPFKEEQDLGIFDRLALAWKILFPPKKMVTPAEIAKQRLKMILISDRCSVNDNAKRKIVNNIVGALANFVEIESQDSVRLNVSADPDLGTVYAVSVPVRRVKPEFQDSVADELRENVRNSEIEGNVEFAVGDVEGLLVESQGEGAGSSCSEVEG